MVLLLILGFVGWRRDFVMPKEKGTSAPAPHSCLVSHQQRRHSASHQGTYSVQVTAANTYADESESVKKAGVSICEHGARTCDGGREYEWCLRAKFAWCVHLMSDAPKALVEVLTPLSLRCGMLRLSLRQIPLLSLRALHAGLNWK
jgi:hypothetical protein